MKLNVVPLMDAIERYIAKANDDLEKTLEEEGFASAAEAVAAINYLEDQVAEALNENTDAVLAVLAESKTIDDFLSEPWQKVMDESELRQRLREIFYKEFQELAGQFTYNWILGEDPEVAEIFEEAPAMSAPTHDFISSWSKELSDKMKLTTDNMMEKILRRASEEHLSIDKVTELIADSGIREPGFRARRVATTEVLRLESYTQMESMIQDPLTYKKRWVHRISGNPRENHMAMSGQEVFKRETFTLLGKDGVTYHPKVPRDTCLPAAESINCHCIMEAVRDDSALGMSKEELARLREQALGEVDAEWAMNHQSDKVNVILDMKKPDQIRYFGGKKDGEARLALVQSGVIDTDEKLRKMYKTEESGKMALKSLQELAEDGIFTVSDTILSHSTIGEFTSTNRLAKGGHSQACIDALDASGTDYTVVKTYQNGVRIGYVPNHKKGTKNGDTAKTGRKDADIGQAWFPKEWSDNDIRIAGTYIANRGVGMGNMKFGEYNGVRVGIFMDSDGKPTTIFPDNMKQIKPNGGVEGARD